MLGADLAESLFDRGRLDEVLLILDSCYSYDFAVHLIDTLKFLEVDSFPTIIVSANEGKISTSTLGYSNFLFALKKLPLSIGQHLLGKDIYEAEKYVYDSQDLAVFYPYEDGLLEIALNNLNHDCPVCEGDSCPIAS